MNTQNGQLDVLRSALFESTDHRFDAEPHLAVVDVEDRDFVDVFGLTGEQKAVWRIVKRNVIQGFYIGVAELYFRTAWLGVREQYYDTELTLRQLAMRIGDRPHATISAWFGRMTKEPWIEPGSQKWANLVVLMTEFSVINNEPLRDWESIDLPAIPRRFIAGWRNALKVADDSLAMLQEADIIDERRPVEHETRPAEDDVRLLSRLFADLDWRAVRHSDGREAALQQRARDITGESQSEIPAEALDRLDRCWGDAWQLCDFCGVDMIDWSGRHA